MTNPRLPAKSVKELITLARGLAAADLNQRFVANGGDPAPSTPDELRRYMIEESARWAKTIKTAGVRIDER